MSMNTTYRYELKEEHYRGIAILQEHYGKKIASSNSYMGLKGERKKRPL